MGIINFSFVPSLGLACKFKDFDYIDRMMVETTFPLILMGIFALCSAAFRLLAYCRSESASSLEKRYPVPDDLRDDFSDSEFRHHRKIFRFCDKTGDWFITKEEMKKVYFD